MLDSAQEAIENGNTEARWKMVEPPAYGQDYTYPAIVFDGVQYGDELPEDLRKAGVTVVNEKEDVMDQ